MDMQDQEDVLSHMTSLLRYKLTGAYEPLKVTKEHATYTAC